MVAVYIPKRGDIIDIDFDPALGHEQKKRRPAVVLSPQNYNQKSGRLVCCPVTSHIKGYPFEVKVKIKNRAGAILSDQLRTLDWNVRHISFLGEVSPTILQEVQEKVKTLVVS